jgi:hypothetical protein
LTKDYRGAILFEGRFVPKPAIQSKSFTPVTGGTPTFFQLLVRMGLEFYRTDGFDSEYLLDHPPEVLHRVQEFEKGKRTWFNEISSYIVRVRIWQPKHVVIAKGMASTPNAALRGNGLTQPVKFVKATVSSSSVKTT